MLQHPTAVRLDDGLQVFKNEVFWMAGQTVSQITSTRTRVLVQCRYYTQVLILQQALRQLLVSEDRCYGFVRLNQAGEMRLTDLSLERPGPPWVVIVADRADLDEEFIWSASDFVEYNCGRKPSVCIAIRQAGRGRQRIRSMASLNWPLPSMALQRFIRGSLGWIFDEPDDRLQLSSTDLDWRLRLIQCANEDVSQARSIPEKPKALLSTTLLAHQIWLEHCTGQMSKAIEVARSFQERLNRLRQMEVPEDYPVKSLLRHLAGEGLLDFSKLYVRAILEDALGEAHSPQGLEALIAAANELHEAGRFADAWAVLTHGLNLSWWANWPIALSRLLLARATQAPAGNWDSKARHRTLLEALHYAEAAHDTSLVKAVKVRIAHTLLELGAGEEAKTLLENLVQGDRDDTAMPQLLYTMATLAGLERDYERARVLQEEAMRHQGRSSKDQRLLSFMFYQMAVIEHRTGRISLAHGWLEAAYGNLMKNSCYYSAGLVLRKIGWLDLELGNYEQAANCFEEATLLANEMGWRLEELRNLLYWLEAIRRGELPEPDWKSICDRAHALAMAEGDQEALTRLKAWRASDADSRTQRCSPNAITS